VVRVEEHRTKRRVFWASSAIVAMGGIVLACSGSNTDTFSGSGADAGTGADAVEEEEAVAPIEAGGGTCKLPDGLSSGRQTCDDCLLERCCQTIVACYDDPACEEMNDCLTTCRKKHGISDAGADCTRACAEKDEATAEKLLDMLDCQSNRCATECKG
jgi:hypothetical protein